MSVNMSAGVDPKKAKRYGKYYGSIDFEANQHVPAQAFHDEPTKPVLGKFQIGGKTFDVTWQELDLIASTAKDAQDLINKRYKMGMMGKIR